MTCSGCPVNLALGDEIRVASVPGGGEKENREIVPEDRVLGGNPDRAGVEVTWVEGAVSKQSCSELAEL